MEPTPAKQKTSQASASMSCGALPLHRRTCEVGIELGVHFRAATMLVKLERLTLVGEKGEIAAMIKDGRTIYPTKSITDVMGLCLGEGSRLVLTVEGASEETAKTFLDAAQNILKHRDPVAALHDKRAVTELMLGPKLVERLLKPIVEIEKRQ